MPLLTELEIISIFHYKDGAPDGAAGSLHGFGTGIGDNQFL